MMMMSAGESEGCCVFSACVAFLCGGVIGLQGVGGESREREIGHMIHRKRVEMNERDGGGVS